MLESDDLKNNKDILTELLKLHNSNRIDYNDRKWETIKFFQTIISALLAGTVAAIIGISENSVSIFVKIAIISLPVISCFSSFFALDNLWRESRLLYLEELQMFKIANLLGINTEVKEDKRWLSGDRYLLLDKWRLNNYGTGDKKPTEVEEWVKARMDEHRFFDIFEKLFGIEILISFVLSIIILIS